MANSYHSWRTGVQIDNMYPIGSIYISVNSTNPGSLFGGTWEELTGGQFLITQNSTYVAGTTGGTTTHSHTQVSTTSGGPSNNTSGGPSNNTSGSTAITVAQMPSHRHDLVRQQWWNVDAVYSSSTNSIFNWRSGTGGTTSASYHDGNAAIQATGGGQGHTHTLSSHTHSLQSHTHTTSATTTGEASNIPPWFAVYMWQRIN